MPIMPIAGKIMARTQRQNKLPCYPTKKHQCGFRSVEEQLT